MKATEYQNQTARHILVYGEPKSGKTELIGALAEHYKLWWFDLDNGVKTLLAPESKAYPYIENLEIFPIPDSSVFPIAVETLLKVLKGGLCEVCNAHGKVSCPKCKQTSAPTTSIDTRTLDNKRDIVVIDSYSQLMESTMNWIMKDSIAKEDYDAKPGWDEYGKQGRVGSRFGSIFQTAPFNIIVTSHAIMATLEDKSKKLVPVGGTENASLVFAKWFDDVVYTEVVNRSYKAYTSVIEKANTVLGSRARKKLVDDKGNQLGLVELMK